MTVHPLILEKQAEIEAFCQRHHIIRLWIFGSALRDDFSIDSDIDVLVEFDPSYHPAWDYFIMPDELEAIFGRSVDFGTPKALRSNIRDRVMRSAELIYERE